VDCRREGGGGTDSRREGRRRRARRDADASARRPEPPMYREGRKEGKGREKEGGLACRTH